MTAPSPNSVSLNQSYLCRNRYFHFYFSDCSDGQCCKWWMLQETVLKVTPPESRWTKRKGVTSFSKWTSQRRERVLVLPFCWERPQEHPPVPVCPADWPTLLWRSWFQGLAVQQSRVRWSWGCGEKPLPSQSALTSLWKISFETNFIVSVRKRLKERECNHFVIWIVIAYR